MLYETDFSITGHVLIPGNKKFRHNTSFLDLIHQGGGFENESHLKNTFFEKAYLSRWDSDEFKRKVKYFRLDSVLVGKSLANLKLRKGDEVRIFSKSEIEGLIKNEVFITGSVKNPGTYDLVEKMRIKDLLFIAGGFEDDSFSMNIFLTRAHLARFNKLTKKKDLIILNLKEIIDEEKGNLLLRTW